MKYSIIINPHSENSDAVEHAQNVIKAILNKNQKICGVFFYGYAVKYAFINDNKWKLMANQGVPLIACSTIAESFDSKLQDYFKLSGLGQWMDMILDSDKTVEIT